MEFFRNETAFIRLANKEERICYLLLFSIFLPFVLSAIVMLSVFVYLICHQESREKIFRVDSFKWFAAFSIPLGFSALVQENWLGVGASIGVAVILLLGFWISAIMKKDIFENCLNLMVFLSFPVSLIAYAQKIWYILVPGDIVRTASVFFNPNYYGAVIELLVLVCLYKLFSAETTARKLYCFLALICNFVAMYLSDSFSAWAAIAVSVAAYLLFNKKFKLLFLFFGIGVTGLLLLIAFPEIMPRMSGVADAFSLRAYHWKSALDAFWEDPIVGKGTLGFWIVSQYETIPLRIQPHAHSLYIDPLLNYGIFGTVALIGVFVSQYIIHFKNTLKSNYKKIGLLTGAVIIAIAVHGINDVTILWHQSGLLLLFLLSGLSLAPNEERAASMLRIRSKMQKGLVGLGDAVLIRQEVFVKEQGFVGEFDDIDANAWHVVLYDGDVPIATGRTFLKNGEFVIGRVAVRKDYRRLHVGSVVIQKLEEKIESLGGKSARLSAQLQVQPFYEKLGYQTEGSGYYDEHTPHIDMVKMFD